MNQQLPLISVHQPGIASALEVLATTSGLEERGAVFTKDCVVEAILDLSGYTEDLALEEYRLLEPSFGDGQFLLAAVERLLRSLERRGVSPSAAVGRMSNSITAIEVHRESYSAVMNRLVERLKDWGLGSRAAGKLAAGWLLSDDFLLVSLEAGFDFVIGNPPYVRQERIPASLLAAYKERYSTLYDRADLYVLFYERGLDLLRDKGILGFICANRWLKNKYGGPLRQKVGSGFNLDYFVDLEGADAFHSEVAAYPAITIIRRGQGKRTLVAIGDNRKTGGLQEVVGELKAGRCGKRGTATEVVSVKKVARGREPWLLDSPRVLGTLRDCEERFPTLEEDGSKVGIGVATGADRVYVGDYETLPIEPERKLRLAMARDCVGSDIRWGGKAVVNPYLESGELASLEDFPLFAAYLQSNRDVLTRRHVARKAPNKWYKTIDRIYPALCRQPKLLIPDIKGDARVTYEGGEFYPHHNLYVVTSTTWELRALQAVLRSSVAMMFVAAYSVRMAGGFLRFQAQYLRRIRIPRWEHLSTEDKTTLAGVSDAEQAAIDAVVFPLYGLRGHCAEEVREFAEAARVSGGG